MTDTEKAEYARVLEQLIAENDRLKTENERLSSALGAHGTLKAIYSDSTQPATVRVRAAQAALNVETPALRPQEPAIDVTAEPIIPLAELVTMRRKHVDQLLREQRQIRVLRDGRVLVLDEGDDGNGGGD